MTLFSLVESEDPTATIIRVDDRGSMIFWNISNLPHDYKTSHLRRQQFSRIRIILINFSEGKGLCGTISSYGWAWWHYVPQIFWWSGEMDRLPLFSLLWLNLQTQQNSYYQWNILSMEYVCFECRTVVSVHFCKKWSECIPRMPFPSDSPPASSPELLSAFQTNWKLSIFRLFSQNHS